MYGKNAPALTAEGFKTGCSQPGPVKPLVSKTIDISGLKITISKGSVHLKTKDPLIARALTLAAEAVGNSSLRITIEN
jgi:hypothetical protein